MAESPTAKTSIRKIGLTLADELGEIVDRLGEDHPDLPGEILGYIETLSTHHPDWLTVFANHFNTRIPGSTARSGRIPHLKS